LSLVKLVATNADTTLIHQFESSFPTLLNNLNGQIANLPYDDSDIANVGQFCKLSRYSVGVGDELPNCSTRAKALNQDDPAALPPELRVALKNALVETDVTVHIPLTCRLTRDSFPRYTLTHGRNHVERKAVPLSGGVNGYKLTET